MKKEKTKAPGISRATIDRLPLYFRTLRLVQDEGLDIIAKKTGATRNRADDRVTTEPGRPTRQGTRQGPTRNPNRGATGAGKTDRDETPGTATRTTGRPKNRNVPKKPMSHMIALPRRETRKRQPGTRTEAEPRNGPNGRPRRNQAGRNRTLRRTKARHPLDKAASSCHNIDAQATPPSRQKRKYLLRPATEPGTAGSTVGPRAEAGDRCGPERKRPKRAETGPKDHFRNPRTDTQKKAKKRTSHIIRGQQGSTQSFPLFHRPSQKKPKKSQKSLDKKDGV